MQQHIWHYSAYLDETAPDQTIHLARGALIPANQLHQRNSGDPSAYGMNDKFFGVYILMLNENKIKISIGKKLQLRKNNSQLQSKVLHYSYNLSWASNYKGESVTRIIRFDNQDDFPQQNLNHLTLHHFHINMESDNSDIECKPTPAHIGSGFPHISDVFDLAFSVLTNRMDFVHKKAMETFKNIPNSDKEQVNIWIPQVSPYLPTLSNLL